MSGREQSAEREGQAWNDLLLSVIKRYYNPRVDQGIDGKNDRSVGIVRCRLVNRLCGDTVTVKERRETDGGPERFYLETQGCAVCRASATLAEQSIADLKSDAARSLCDSMVALINGSSPENAFPATLPCDTIRDLEAFQALREVPGRRRCATLSWEALRTVLAEESNR